ncbi:unnamed protein product [Notodromas monacha]|uniref:RRM domain-containing protein n=1 Tax=Notodromas monacha TaxID=399045 RepID=A0A7R9GLP5_9CRUS|nr:unnamed protein product [Notodromas monacha]CAG0925216.1 unnamed protein product [Notodromas monacha]
MSYTPRTKIFVGRLPEVCNAEELRALFEKYGTVTECDVLNRFGFVHMSTAEEAEEAIKCLNQINFKGSRITVEHSTGKRGWRSLGVARGSVSLRSPMIVRSPELLDGRFSSVSACRAPVRSWPFYERRLDSSMQSSATAAYYNDSYFR